MRDLDSRTTAAIVLVAVLVLGATTIAATLLTTAGLWT